MSKQRYIFAEKPNVPIITWLLSSIAAKITDGSWQELFELIAFGALFTWAWLEIFHGTNTFRRILGGVVLLISLRTRIG